MQPLDGFSVLLTRPQGYNAALAGLIESAGGTAIHAPMIVVTGLTDKRAASAALESLPGAEIVVFVSRNAASFGLGMAAEEGLSLCGKAVYAVGPGTVSELADLGVDGVSAPESEYSTEGLLKLESLQEDRVSAKQVLIFRGLGGREALASELRARGASVSYCECYERRKPQVDIGRVLEHSGVSAPDIALATSGESLRNLVDTIAEQGLEHLFDMRILAVGPRVAREVEPLGFTTPPLVVENPSDDSILRRMIKWAEEEA